MENYKKKSFKFGQPAYSKEVRNQERASYRAEKRGERLSVLRNLYENEPERQIKPPARKAIPQPVAARTVMLQKWKQEKIIKKQVESKLKKPVFKAGAASVGSQQASATGRNPSASSRLQQSRIQISSSYSFNKTLQTSSFAIQNKVSSAASRSQLAPKLPEKKEPQPSTSGIARRGALPVPNNKPKMEISNINKFAPRIPSKLSQPQSTIGMPKPPIARIPNKSSQATLSIPKRTGNATGGKSSASAQVSQVSGPRQIASKMPNASTLQSKNVFPTRNVSKASDLRSSAMPNKSAIPNRNVSKLPDIRSRSQLPPLEPKGDKPTLKTNLKQSNNALKTKVVPKPDLKKSAVPKSEDNLKDEAFEWELSSIEPLESTREKSFAPLNFVFSAPIELRSSIYLKEGPSAIFMRMKSERQRTSTPKPQANKPEEDCTLDNKESGSLLSPNATFQTCPMSLRFDDGVPKEDSNILSNSAAVTEVDNDQNQEAAPPAVHSPNTQASPKQEVKADVQNQEAASSVVHSPDTEASPKQEVKTDDDQNQEAVLSVVHSPDTQASPKQEVKADDDQNQEAASSVVHSPNTEASLKQEVKADDVDSDVFTKCDSIENLAEKDWGKNSNTQKTRNDRPNNRPVLESISEGMENSSPAGPSTPGARRRSKAFLPADFTPRRSLRLARLSELNSPDMLTNVARPTVFFSPGSDPLESPAKTKETIASAHARIAYDFAELHLETVGDSEAPQSPISTRHNTRKVSLLGTPPARRRQTIRQSIREDLMSFSPS